MQIEIKWFASLILREKKSRIILIPFLRWQWNRFWRLLYCSGSIGLGLYSSWCGWAGPPWRGSLCGSPCTTRSATVPNLLYPSQLSGQTKLFHMIRDIHWIFWLFLLLQAPPPPPLRSIFPPSYINTIFLFLFPFPLFFFPNTLFFRKWTKLHWLTEW